MKGINDNNDNDEFAYLKTNDEGIVIGVDEEALASIMNQGIIRKNKSTFGGSCFLATLSIFVGLTIMYTCKTYDKIMGNDSMGYKIKPTIFDKKNPKRLYFDQEENIERSKELEIMTQALDYFYEEHKRPPTVKELDEAVKNRKEILELINAGINE